MPGFVRYGHIFCIELHACIEEVLIAPIATFYFIQVYEHKAKIFYFLIDQKTKN